MHTEQELAVCVCVCVVAGGAQGLMVRGEGRM